MKIYKVHHDQGYVIDLEVDRPQFAGDGAWQYLQGDSAFDEIAKIEERLREIVGDSSSLARAFGQ